MAHKADIVQEACKLGRLERLEVSLGDCGRAGRLVKISGD